MGGGFESTIDGVFHQNTHQGRNLEIIVSTHSNTTGDEPTIEPAIALD